MKIQQIGSATLYHADCLEVLPSLPPVDMVLTDPPYSERTHKMAKTNKGAGHGTKLVTFEALTDETFCAAMRACVTASLGWVVATCDYRHLALLLDWPEFIRVGAWVKPNPMPQISADRPGQGFEVVAILHSGKTPKAWNRGGAAGVWTVSPEREAQVPTQKPQALANALLGDFSGLGATILDPFMGSGTTGVAACANGRQFIGIEQDAERFEIACKRIENAQRQNRMFA